MPNKVTKNDLVDAIYQKTKCEKQVIQSVVDSFLMEVKSSLEEGSTIELSADGPLRPPYAAYMQGGLNYAHVKIALKGVLNEIFNSEVKNG